MDYLERLTAHYHATIQDHPQAYQWLRNRGINDESIAKYKLGYVAGASNGMERFNGCISIPYLRPNFENDEQVQRVCSLRFRHFVGLPHHKYDALKGTRAHLFNVEATEEPNVYITEGEFDSIILTQLGFPAVGIPGASLFNTSWKYLFSNTNNVTIVFDGDEAGQKGSQRIASILGEVCPKLSRVLTPPGQDVTDMYLRSPRELVRLIT